MEIIPPYLRIYQQLLKDLENAFPFLNVKGGNFKDKKVIGSVKYVERVQYIFKLTHKVRIQGQGAVFFYAFQKHRAIGYICHKMPSDIFKGP